MEWNSLDALSAIKATRCAKFGDFTRSSLASGGLPAGARRGVTLQGVLILAARELPPQGVGTFEIAAPRRVACAMDGIEE